MPSNKPEQYVFAFLPGISPLGETRSFVEVIAPRLAKRYQMAGHREPPDLQRSNHGRLLARHNAPSLHDSFGIIKTDTRQAAPYETVTAPQVTGQSAKQTEALDVANPFRAAGMDPRPAAPEPNDEGALPLPVEPAVNTGTRQKAARSTLSKREIARRLRELSDSLIQAQRDAWDRQPEETRYLRPGAVAVEETSLRVLPPCASASGFDSGHTQLVPPARTVARMRAGRKTA